MPQKYKADIGRDLVFQISIVNTPSLGIQLSLIYKQEKSFVPINILDVQQEYGYDCGLFAITNLVEFVLTTKTLIKKQRLRPKV